MSNSNSQRGQQRFATNPKVQFPRCMIKTPFTHKTTFNSGELFPLFKQFVLPGDTFTVKYSAVVRCATQLHPVMDNLSFQTHYFFVPHRLVFSDWAKLMGEQDNPTDSIDYLVPQMSTFTAKVGDLANHFGLPIGVPLSGVSALPFRAYNLIWNQWFRDENLQNSMPEYKDEGPDGYESSRYTIKTRNKVHDYFTSCLPFPQKGDPVSISLVGNAPIIAVDGGQPTFNIPTSSGVLPGGLKAVQVNPSAGYFGAEFLGGEPTANANITWNDPKLATDLSGVSVLTIEQLRESITTQQFRERDARGGTRYIEKNYSQFGVMSPDARLQRSEILGATTDFMSANALPQTSFQLDGTPPQGNLVSNGQFSIANKLCFHKSFTEHGYIIALGSIRSYPTYQQGVERDWYYSTMLDHPFPIFAHLGEQEVFNKEIYVDGTSADNDVFGYQFRYAELKYKPSLITGYLNSNAPDTIDSWTYAQHFTSRPVLSSQFVEDLPPVSRTIADSDTVSFEFLGDFQFDMVAVRVLPARSSPSGLSSGRLI
jgi:hypothetical protein